MKKKKPSLVGWPFYVLFQFDSVSELVFFLQFFYFFLVIFDEGWGVNRFAFFFVVGHDLLQLVPSFFLTGFIFINSDNEFTMFWNTYFHLTAFFPVSFLIHIVMPGERSVKMLGEK